MTIQSPKEVYNMTYRKLSELGMSESEAKNKALLFEQSYELLIQKSSSSISKLACYYVPGRLEFLGKHTDYCGGRSLLCAIEKGLCFVCVPRTDKTINIWLTANGEHRNFEFADHIEPTHGDWSNYPMTVAKRLAKNFEGELKGADIVFTSDLPQAAGMSSSSAIVVAMWLALNGINHFEQHAHFKENIQTDNDLAGYLGCNENGQSFKNLVGDKGVGTFGGSEDHTAIMFSESDQLKQYGFCPVKHEKTVSLPQDYRLVIGVCGVDAEKTGAAQHQYNRASLLVSELINIWKSHKNTDSCTLAAIIRSQHDALNQLVEMTQDADCQYSHDDLANRVKQFAEESEVIIPTVSQLIESGNTKNIGPFIEKSQQLTSNWLQNQIPETDYLASSATKLGAIAASAFGAGFGGSVWALVKKNEVEQFTESWKVDYLNKYPKASKKAVFFPTKAGPSASRLA